MIPALTSMKCPHCNIDAIQTRRTYPIHNDHHVIETRKCPNDHNWIWISNPDCEDCMFVNRPAKLIRTKNFYFKEPN